MKAKFHKFKVFPESGSPRYIWVKIHPDKAAKNLHIKKSHTWGKLTEGDFDGEGNWFGYERVLVSGDGSDEKVHPEFGTINLHLERLGSEVISHECAHAAVRFAAAANLNYNAIFAKDSGVMADDEERFCYALGSMVRQIVDYCWDNKLIKV